MSLRTATFYALLCLFFHFGTGGYAQSVQLQSFDSLKSALESGLSVRVTIYYAHCRPLSGDKKIVQPNEVVTGFLVNKFDYFPKNSVRNNRDFLNMVSSQLEEHLNGKGHVFSLLQVRVFEDGEVLIHKRSINPLTYENETAENFETRLIAEDGDKAGIILLKTGN